MRTFACEGRKHVCVDVGRIYLTVATVYNTRSGGGARSKRNSLLLLKNTEQRNQRTRGRRVMPDAYLGTQTVYGHTI